MAGRRCYPLLVLLAACTAAPAGGTGDRNDGGGGGAPAFPSGGAGGEGATGGLGGEGSACPEDPELDGMVLGPADPNWLGFDQILDGIVVQHTVVAPDESRFGEDHLLVIEADEDAWVRVLYSDPHDSLAPPFAVGDRVSARSTYVAGGSTTVSLKVRLTDSRSNRYWDLSYFENHSLIHGEDPDWSTWGGDYEVRKAGDSGCEVRPPIAGDGGLPGWPLVPRLLFPLKARRPGGAWLEIAPWTPVVLEDPSGTVRVLATGVLGFTQHETRYARSTILASYDPVEQPSTCDRNNPCPEGRFCDLSEGTCDGAGRCRPTPEGCLISGAGLEPQTVCGCDGNVYPGVCEANRAGTDVVFPLGTCPLTHFVCGPEACRIGEEACVRDPQMAGFCLRASRLAGCGERVDCECARPTLPRNCACSEVESLGRVMVTIRCVP